MGQAALHRVDDETGQVCANAVNALDGVADREPYHRFCFLVFRLKAAFHWKVRSGLVFTGCLRFMKGIGCPDACDGSRTRGTDVHGLAEPALLVETEMLIEVRDRLPAQAVGGVAGGVGAFHDWLVHHRDWQITRNPQGKIEVRRT
jgi:hypothetical protein